TVNGPVAAAPSVRVTDAFGNPVAGVAVTFAVASGGGGLTGASATTNASGVATVGSWTLGTVAGSNTLTATAAGLAGSPLTFTATGVAGAANAAQSSATVPGGAKGSQTTITIQLRDQFGNVLTTGGASVVVTITGANPGSAGVADLGDGSYLAGYVPTASGTDQVSITLNGVPIGGSPYSSSIP
ncbi:MAG TPA: filamin/ABP280 repeat domain-containing protein, partial [Gemmatimonadales bacterium]|nr:filamin/ABP280 repeat domain-containing protein [Gemmatimonadales bacterium]